MFLQHNWKNNSLAQAFARQAYFITAETWVKDILLKHAWQFWNSKLMAQRILSHSQCFLLVWTASSCFAYILECIVEDKDLMMYIKITQIKRVDRIIWISSVYRLNKNLKSQKSWKVLIIINQQCLSISLMLTARKSKLSSI